VSLPHRKSWRRVSVPRAFGSPVRQASGRFPSGFLKFGRNEATLSRPRGQILLTCESNFDQGCRFEDAALSRGDLTEVEWRILKVLLPVEREPGKRGRSRPPEDNCNVINGILWRPRTGASWRDVPEKYCKWNSIFRRFRRWSASGVWESVAIALAEIMAESGHYNTDSTTVRAHVSAASGRGFIDELLAARGTGLLIWILSTPLA
jgi:transposase